MRKNYNIYTLIIFIVIWYSYYLLINTWHFIQFSDFQNYYQQALSYKYHQVLDDKFLFFQAPGHPVIMSYWMILLQSDSKIYLQWINIFQYVLILGITFWSNTILPLKYKLIGLWGLSICVSYVSLLGFLNAEINFLLFFIIANYLLINILTKPEMSQWKRNLYVILIGLSFGIAQFIRPLSLFYLLFFISGLLTIKYFFKKKGYFGVTNHNSVKIIFVFIITTFGLYKLTTGYWRYQPTQNGLWSIFVGLNEKSSGRYNAEDIEQFEKIGNNYHWQEDSLRKVLKQNIGSRLQSGLSYNLVHLPQRAVHLLVPYHTSFWFFKLDSSRGKSWDIFMKIIFGVSTLITILALTINLWYFIRLLIKGISDNFDIFTFCSLWSMYLYLAIHISTLEIQPRYANHIIFMNLWIFPFALLNLEKALRKYRIKNNL